MQKLDTDVLIVWQNEGILKVLTVVCRVGQMDSYQIFPEQVSSQLAEQMPSEKIFDPLRQRFLAFGSKLYLLESFVKYNAWVHDVFHVHFHTVDLRGLEGTEMRTNIMAETGNRFFEPPSLVSVQELLKRENDPRRSPYGHGFRNHLHFLGLRHLFENDSRLFPLSPPPAPLIVSKA
ncbi:TPA: hypothetical protein DCQ44_02665 [Candidatus Taylorbacteria bacterium]|nr:hypothetical protein [Candidatus Taylorbacteria bacterium]